MAEKQFPISFPAHLKVSASGNGGRREAKRLGDIQWIDLFPEGKRWKEGVRAIKKAIETISLEAAPAEKARGNRHR